MRQVDHRPIGQLRGLPGVIEVIVFAEGEAAVEHDVTSGVGRVGLDEHEGVASGRKRPMRQPQGVGGPGEGQLRGQPGEFGVACGITPEHEVVGEPVGFGEVDVILDSDVAAVVFSPLVDGAGEFVPGPRARGFVERFAGGAHEQERIHERIVDGALEPRTFAWGAVGGERPEAPVIALAMEGGRPGAVGAWAGGGQRGAVDDDVDGSVEIEWGVATGQFEGEGGDVGEGEPHLLGVGLEHGFDAGGFPVLAEAFEVDPRHATVTEGVSDETDGAGEGIAAEGGGGIDAAVDFGFGFGGVLVAGVGAEDVEEVEVFELQGTFHGAGGLDLAVAFAAVGDGGDHGEVEGVGGGVVKAPEFLFPGAGLERFLLEDAEEFGGFAEAGSGSGGGPEGGVVDGEVPAGGAAQGETSNHETMVVDRVPRLDIGEGFPGVGFAGEPGAVAIAAVGVENERVGGGEFASPVHAFLEEGEFAQLFAPAMEPEVESVSVRGVGVVAVGDDETVGLDRSVDSGDIAEHDETGPGEPGHAAFVQGTEPTPAFRELGSCGSQFVGVVNLAVAHRPIDRLLEDAHIGDAGPCRGGEGGFGRIDGGAELFGAFAENALVLGRDGDAGWGDGANPGGEVVGGAIGSSA